MPPSPVGQDQPLLPDRRLHLSLRDDVERRPIVFPLQVEVAVPLHVIQAESSPPQSPQMFDDRLLEDEGEPGVAEPEVEQVPEDQGNLFRRRPVGEGEEVPAVDVVLVQVGVPGEIAGPERSETLFP